MTTQDDVPQLEEGKPPLPRATALDKILTRLSGEEDEPASAAPAEAPNLKRVDEVDQRVDRVDQRVDEVDQRVDMVEQKVDAIAKKEEASWSDDGWGEDDPKPAPAPKPARKPESTEEKLTRMAQFL